MGEGQKGRGSRLAFKQQFSGDSSSLQLTLHSDLGSLGEGGDWEQVSFMCFGIVS